MSKHIVKRNFAKLQGMAYVGDVLTNIPEPYVSDWTASGLIEPYNESNVVQIPETMTTSTTAFKRHSEEQTGKPTKKARKK